MVFAHAYMFVYNVRVCVRVLADVALLCVRIHVRILQVAFISVHLIPAAIP